MGIKVTPKSSPVSKLVSYISPDCMEALMSNGLHRIYIMSHPKAREPRTVMKVPISFRQYVVRESGKLGIEPPVFLEGKIVVPAEPGYPGGSTPDAKYIFSKGGGG